MARNKLPRTANDPVMALSLDEIYDGTVAEMFDSLNENFETIGAEGAIKANSLDSNAVTTDKINDNAVTTAKIANSNVTTAKIADLNVTTAKIANSNITTDKLDLSDLSSSTYFKNMLLNLIYPIGSYYWSSNSTSPQSFLGGVWERITGRFLYAEGEDQYLNQTSGSSTVTLTLDQIPSHNHQGDFQYDNYGTHISNTHASQAAADVQVLYLENTYGHQVIPPYNGGNQPHDNMPPYIRAACWKRTA